MRIILFWLCLISFSFGQSFEKPLVDDNSKYTNTGNIGLTISNFGTFGDGFVQQSPIDQPSCMYPKGSGIEHIFGGGLWVGALTSEGIKVTTGAFNSPRFQSAGSSDWEFTNTAQEDDITIERSSLPDNKFFSPQAISHQDFIADFVDTNVFIPGGNIPIPNHVPMGLDVHLETYAWNFPFADAFVIFNYTIKNVWEDTLKDVYVGLWADLVVRNVNITPPRVGAPFYQHAGVGFVESDTMNFVYTYDYDGDPGFTDSYVAMVHLGAEPQVNDFLYDYKTTHNWWLFSGGVEDYEIPPREETLRYERMRESFSNTIYESNLFQSGGNWMSLISTGPFERIDPDSSINVVFAIVCAKKAGFNPSTVDNLDAKRNLFDNVGWALRAYHGEDSNRNGILDFAGTDSSEDVNGNGKLDRYILPTPPAPPRLKAIAENQKITLLWDDFSENSIDLISKEKDFEGYRVYRSFIGDEKSTSGLLGELKLIHEFDLKNGSFYDTGLEAVMNDEPVTETINDPITGDPVEVNFKYKLEIDNLHNGWQYAFAISAFDSGNAKINLPSLESSKLQNVVLVTPGTVAQQDGINREIGVYPNPYRASALWDGNFERDRKLYFYNLPERCEIRIYTLAGDLVDSFRHDADSYTGLTSISDDQNPVFSGGEHAWDMVSKFDQAIATGLYLFTVKDLDHGDVFKGKFVIIK